MVDRTFGDLADDYANHAHDRPWFDARHAHLSELLTAFWLGEFEDKSGDCQLSIQLASNYRAAPDPCTRELLFRVLPTGAPWMPAEVRYCDSSSPPYDVLARMQPRHYEPGSLLILMEKITIRDEDYHAWRRSHQKGYARPGSRSDDAEIRLNLNRDSQTKGGLAPKYHAGLQQFIDQLFAKFERADTRLTSSSLHTWLAENAPKDAGHETGIPSCDDVELYDNKVWWRNRQGHQKSATLRTIERYISRAKDPADGKAA